MVTSSTFAARQRRAVQCGRRRRAPHRGRRRSPSDRQLPRRAHSSARRRRSPVNPSNQRLDAARCRRRSGRAAPRGAKRSRYGSASRGFGTLGQHHAQVEEQIVVVRQQALGPTPRLDGGRSIAFDERGAEPLPGVATRRIRLHRASKRSGGLGRAPRPTVPARRDCSTRRRRRDRGASSS